MHSATLLLKESLVAKNLVIVESPGKVKTISKVLGKNFVVKASVGHVRDLATSKKDDKQKDHIVNGVAKDFTPIYITLPNKAKVVEDLKKAAKGAEKIYLCPDPDREGEAIAWHLAEALRLEPERIVRVTFDEITPRGIKAGFSSPRNINMDRVNSQQARKVLDRIVGFKLSNLLWDKIVRGLSAGRVQSVAVRLLVDREKEIQAFIAEPYWTVAATFLHEKTTFDANLRALDGKQVVSSAEDLSKFKSGMGQMGSSGIVRTLIKDAEEANAIVEALRKASYAVSFYEVKEVQDRPYPPFATSQLQQAAANRLGFDPKRTMRIAQQLYEGVPLGDQGPVALITYMRTDSFRISPDALNECRDQIKKLYGDKYIPEKPNFYASRSGAQEAHECIRPTHVEMTPQDIKQYLSDEQFKLYKLIWERFVTCQMVPAIFDATTADIAASGPNTRNAVFRATGRVLKFDGWLIVQGGAAAAAAAAHVEASAADREKGDEAETPQEEESGSQPAQAAAPAKKPAKKKTGSQLLPPMKVGDKPELQSITPEEHFTQPPPRYTEASLIKKLEREGIGRPSTYASIISTIQERGYVQKLGTGGRGSLMATPLGRVVTERLEGHFPTIMELGFTRDMELELDKIEETHLDWKQVIKEFYGPFSKDLEKAKKQMTSTKEQGEPTDVKCPDCNSPMEKRLSKFGYYLRCTKAPECKATYRLDAQGNIQKKEGPQPTGIKCDLCGSDVVKSTGRFGPYLHCVKYANKECTFTMKLNKEGHPIRKFAALPTDRACEKCKSPLVVRVTSRGKTRRPFLSCSNFPKCRAAADLPPELAELGEKAMDQWRASDAKNKRDLALYQAVLAQQAKDEPGEGEAADE
ncbi:MAG TPA: type I DNA topoisomerase [Planctomycetota bacterium]|nr:type I DNA topoisomerase [Planctomycetota bacterium]